MHYLMICQSVPISIQQCTTVQYKIVQIHLHGHTTWWAISMPREHHEQPPEDSLPRYRSSRDPWTRNSWLSTETTWMHLSAGFCWLAVGVTDLRWGSGKTTCSSVHKGSDVIVTRNQPQLNIYFSDKKKPREMVINQDKQTYGLHFKAY